MSGKQELLHQLQPLKSEPELPSPPDVCSPGLGQASQVRGAVGAGSRVCGGAFLGGSFRYHMLMVWRKGSRTCGVKRMLLMKYSLSLPQPPSSLEWQSAGSEGRRDSYIDTSGKVFAGTSIAPIFPRHTIHIEQIDHSAAMKQTAQSPALPPLGLSELTPLGVCWDR